MKEFLSVLILILHSCRHAQASRDETLKVNNLNSLVDDVLFASMIINPLYLRQCIPLRGTVLFVSLVWNLDSVRRPRDIVLVEEGGKIWLTVFLEVTGVDVEFEFFLKQYPRARAMCKLKIIKLAGHLQLKWNYRTTLEQFEIDELDTNKYEFECDRVLPHDVYLSIKEALEFAANSGKTRLVNYSEGWTSFGSSFLHMKGVIWYRFCKAGLMSYCDPNIIYGR